jgi:hypothetical protein
MPPLEPSDGLGAQVTDEWWGEGIAEGRGPSLGPHS